MEVRLLYLRTWAIMYMFIWYSFLSLIVTLQRQLPPYSWNCVSRCSLNAQTTESTNYCKCCFFCAHVPVVRFNSQIGHINRVTVNNIYSRASIAKSSSKFCLCDLFQNTVLCATRPLMIMVRWVSSLCNFSLVCLNCSHDCSCALWLLLSKTSYSNASFAVPWQLVC